jgi:predicted transcriptional regulator
MRTLIDRSREHTSRLMKALFDRGFVVRNDRNKPFVYEITEAGRRYLTSGGAVAGA